MDQRPCANQILFWHTVLNVTEVHVEVLHYVHYEDSDSDDDEEYI